MSRFKKAQKHQAKLRLAIFGPSGAGKTMSALRIAHGLDSRVALIDSERKSASKYADRWEFDVLELDDKTISAGYVPAIQDASKEGYPVLIIDSLSHAWQELLEEVDSIAKAKYRGNTWSAWSEGTPKQRRLVNAILDYPGHVIATMRSDTEWNQEKDERTGKVKPVKVGLKPQQGKGIEYEFDMLMEMNVEHFANVTKDRTGKFQDRFIEKPDEDFGRELVEWLNTGNAPLPTAKELAAQHNMTTGDKVKNGRKTAEEKADETEAEELRLYEKYKRAFACVWTSSGMDRVLTNLSEEGTQPLKAKLKICHEEAERRVRLSEAESIDADTMAEIGDWMAKTPKLSDLESFCEWAFNAQPSPFTETQKTTLYRWLEREQQKHAKPVGA